MLPLVNEIYFRFRNKLKQSPGGILQKAVPEHFAKFTRKCLFGSLVLVKWQVVGLKLHLKKTPTWVGSCEFCIIFENSFFIDHLRVPDTG